MYEFYETCHHMLLMKQNTFRERLEVLKPTGSIGDTRSQHDASIRNELQVKLAAWDGVYIKLKIIITVFAKAVAV